MWNIDLNYREEFQTTLTVCMKKASFAIQQTFASHRLE
jgi:hypothetical protein